MPAVATEPAAHDLSPGPIVDAILGFQKTAAMIAAVNLDLFAAIGGGTTATGPLAAKTGAAERGIRILCDYLTVHGFLTKSGHDYGLTPSAAAFLDSKSAAYLGGIVHFLASPEMTGMFLEDPTSYVRQGGSIGMANMSPDNPIWVKFAEAMVPFIAPMAEGLAAAASSMRKPPKKVLDIAAGHGMFGIAVGKAVSEAEIVACDWGIVLTLAQRNAEAASIGKRYTTVAGSAFDVDWGSGYDLILLPNFLHHFDPPTCAKLLRKVRSSLLPDGKVIAVEFVPNEDRVSPHMPAAFSFMMLGTTPRGDAYTASELDDMARDSGFSGASVKPILPTPGSLVFFEP